MLVGRCSQDDGAPPLWPWRTVLDGIGMSLLASDSTLVGGTGAPTLAFNHTDGPNMAGEPPMLLSSGRWPTEPD